VYSKVSLSAGIFNENIEWKCAVCYKFMTVSWKHCKTSIMLLHLGSCICTFYSVLNYTLQVFFTSNVCDNYICSVHYVILFLMTSPDLQKCLSAIFDENELRFLPDK